MAIERTTSITEAQTEYREKLLKDRRCTSCGKHSSVCDQAAFRGGCTGRAALTPEERAAWEADKKEHTL